MSASRILAGFVLLASFLPVDADAQMHRRHLRMMRRAHLYGYPAVRVRAPGVRVNVGAPYAPRPYTAVYGPYTQAAPQPVYPLAHQPGCIGGNCAVQQMPQAYAQPQQFATNGAMCPSQGGTCRVGRNVYAVRIDPRAQARCAREAQIMANRQQNWTRRDGGHPLGIDPSTGARVGGTGAGMRPDCEVCQPNNPRRYIVIGDASVKGRDGRWYRSVAYRPMRS